MKKRTFLKMILGTLAALYSVIAERTSYGEGRGGGMMGGMMGNGMMGGRCPMCGNSWEGRGGSFGSIPEKLPKPKSREWVNNLQEVLSLEKESKTQYEADYEKYHSPMPYRMIIPQEDNHIQWITQLFNAYGLPSDGKVPPVIKSETLDKALEIAMKLENDLVPRYEWLIHNVEDTDSGEVLNTALLQTRMHYTMFNHALRMGGMMGRHMMGQ